MSDRTSAEIFGDLFRLLAETPASAFDRIPLAVWKMSQRYDFSQCQADADEALVKLGLAKVVQKDGENWVEYADADGRLP